MSKTETGAPALLHKSVSVDGVTIVDEDKGIVEAYVAGIGNKDSVSDIIEPGAFVESLKTRKPKGVWSHDWDRPVSKTLDIYEVPAGDARLPQKMKDAKIGGLYVKTQFNLDTTDGRDAFSWVKFFDTDSEWSIGYRVEDSEYDTKAKAMRLKQIDLFEYSPVLFGANPLTSTVGVKVHGAEGGVDIKVEGVNDNMAKKIADAIKGIVDEEAPAEEADVIVEDEVDSKGAAAEEVEGEDDVVVPEATEVEKDAEDADSEASPEGDEPAEEDAVDPEATDEPEAVVEEEKALPALGMAAGLVKDLLTSIDLTTFEADQLKTFVDSRLTVDEKVMVGSFEDIRCKVSKALKEEYERAYVWIHSVFDSKVVYCVDSWFGDEGSQYYEASYTITDDGVEIGDPVEVDVVEVVVAKNANIDAAYKGHGAAVKALLRPFVDMAADEPVVDDEYTKSMTEALAKAGAALSAANKKKLTDAVDTIGSAIATIESVLEGTKTAEVVEEEEEPVIEAKDAEADLEATPSELVELDSSALDEFKAMLAEQNTQ